MSLEDDLFVSAGTAGILNLKSFQVPYPPPRIGYLLLGRNCRGNCSYCPHRNGNERQNPASPRRIAKILWFPVRFSELIDRISQISQISRPPIEGFCLQLSYAPEIYAHAEMLTEVLKSFGYRVMISGRLTNSETERFFRSGADRVSLALDYLGQEQSLVNRKIDSENLIQLAEEWPGRITTHVICGLGESDRDIIDWYFQAFEAGITTGLFAYTPLKQSMKQQNSSPRPNRGRYRAIQLVTYLITRGWLNQSDLAFDSAGKLAGISGRIRQLVISSNLGRAFLTSGCKDCNRPYYNDSPAEVPYNYATPVSPEVYREQLKLALKYFRLITA